MWLHARLGALKYVGLDKDRYELICSRNLFASFMRRTLINQGRHLILCHHKYAEMPRDVLLVGVYSSVIVSLSFLSAKL